MKRSAPLRRTPLPRRRTRIKPRSAKREAISGQRRELVQRLLRERPTCEVPTRVEFGVFFGVHFVPCGQPSVDAHERLSRARGGDILDESDILMTCRPCHDRIHRHPEWSAGLMLLRHSWDR